MKKPQTTKETKKINKTDIYKTIKRYWSLFLVVSIFLIFLIIEIRPSSTPKNFKESIGHKLTMADNIIQSKLRDPNSYKRLNYDEERNSEGKITSIRIEYTAKNGFGGINREVQTITF